MINDITIRAFWKTKTKIKMAHTLESYLVELFPETTHQSSGTHSNIWATNDYEFNFRNNFYKVLATKELVFVKAGDWKDTLNRLKILSNGKGSSPIV